jgi:hypothetical protein
MGLSNGASRTSFTRYAALEAAQESGKTGNGLRPAHRVAGPRAEDDPREDEEILDPLARS